MITRRRASRWLPLVALPVALGACGGGDLRPTTTAPLRVAEPELATVKRWVEEVSLGTEYGGDGKICSRWTHAPTLSVIEGSAEVRASLLELLPLLSSLIAPLSIRQVADGDESADIEVYFTEVRNFDSIGAAKGFSYVPGNSGFFYTFWDERHEIYKAIVLLATDELYGDYLRHFTFEEVTQSLGLSNDSPLFPDSIFFGAGDDGGRAMTLSPLDRALVRFFYSHVSPGDRQPELDAAFDAHWGRSSRAAGAPGALGALGALAGERR